MEKFFKGLFADSDPLREAKETAMTEFIVRNNAPLTDHLIYVAQKLFNATTEVEVTNFRELINNGAWKLTVTTVMSKSSKIQVKPAPGYALMRMLRIVCSKKFVERELAQTHMDAVHELFEAEKKGDKLAARVIPWRLRIQLLAVAGSGLLGWFLSKVRLRIGGNAE